MNDNTTFNPLSTEGARDPDCNSSTGAIAEEVALTRALSNAYGPGASAHTVEELEHWKTVGIQAETCVRKHDWIEADRLVADFCNLRPAWPKGYELRVRTMTHAGHSRSEVISMLQVGICHSEGVRGCEKLQTILCDLQSSVMDSACRSTEHGKSPVKWKNKVKGLKLLPHELTLVEAGDLEDITHEGSSAIWLSTQSATLSDDRLTTVYRPMGDEEFAYLLNNGMLPDTQPYQTIVEGAEGRTYAEKYLRGHKSVDSSPTTVVEFAAPRMLIDHLFQMQSKNEDGAISHGLGAKGGKGLPLFNASLQNSETNFRVVFVKRFEKKKTGAFGANRTKC